MKTSKTRTVRALVVDDEPLARRYLSALLKTHEDIEIVGECGNGFDAVEKIRTLHPELVFLDIQMPRLDGFEVLEALDDDIPKIVFVTAFDEYAIRAFEVHAVDYLLKPFSEDRLSMALERVLSEGATALPGGHEVAQAARGGKPIERIVVKDGAGITLIPVDKVDYISAEEDYIAIHVEGEVTLKLQTLSSMVKSLDSKRYVQIHRSVVLNLDRLKRIESPSKDSKLAVLRDGTTLPISRTGFKRLKDRLSRR